MMKLKINIEIENAAFGDGDPGDQCREVVRILRVYIERIELSDRLRQTLRDNNGNIVGHARLITGPLRKDRTLSADTGGTTRPPDGLAGPAQADFRPPKAAKPEGLRA
jgi:hypothetical protein